MKTYTGPRPTEELRTEYHTLCLSLGRDDIIDNVPTERSELVRKVRELNFDWMHEYHIG